MGGKDWGPGIDKEVRSIPMVVVTVIGSPKGQRGLLDSGYYWELSGANCL